MKLLAWIVLAACLPAATVLASENALPMKEHTLPARANECQFCHMDRKSPFVSKKNSTQMEHTQIVSQHGRQILACNFCHDKANHNRLKSSAEFPASFANPSPVCQRCHAEVYKDWTKGLHGKRTGGWKGEQRQQFHCIECHDPHSVKFKAMEAKPAPQRPKLSIPK
ncbi:MAG: hypothetical protein ACXVA9_03090 [Bdellovibrionales bacterium]